MVNLDKKKEKKDLVLLPIVDLYHILMFMNKHVDHVQHTITAFQLSSIAKMTISSKGNQNYML